LQKKRRAEFQKLNVECSRSVRFAAVSELKSVAIESDRPKSGEESTPTGLDALV
jgi:hypothetical protein